MKMGNFFSSKKMASIDSSSESTGNTKCRRFQLTLHALEKYDELKTYLTSFTSLTYYLAAQEVGEKNERDHIHIYVCFKNSIKLSIKKLCTAHVEKCRGNHSQNIDYLMKQGNIIDEIGEKPRERGGFHTVQDLKQIQNPDELPSIEYNTWCKIHDKERMKISLKDWKKEVKVTYICGPSGAGKSLLAKETLMKEYGEDVIVNIVDHKDSFWNGADGDTKIAVYDDFRDSDLKASEFIKFIDYNTHNLNVKGSFVKNVYERIIITSVQHPEDIYRNMADEPRKQWLRRIEIIDLGAQREENYYL